MIVASGPSAGTIDLSLARGRARFIAINESWRLAPWADVLYGCDDSFWKQKQGVRDFAGLRISQDASACARYSENPRLKVHRVICEKSTDSLVLDRPGHIGWGGNSGLHAINLAVQFGVKKIILVGYDMRLDRGLHWHGKHATGMNNPIERNVERWCRAVDNTAPVLAQLGIDAINCSPVSLLKAFRKMSFNEALIPIAAMPESSARIKQQPMRILAIVHPMAGPHEIFSYGDNYAYYLQDEMVKRGIQLSVYPRNANPEAYFETLPLEQVDHVIGFGLRYFDKNFTRGNLEPIRKRVRGAIAQLAEFPREWSIADINFTSKDIPPDRALRRHAPFHIIGWAADHDLCAPEQQKGGPLRILLDHYDYDPKRTRDDKTKYILLQIKGLKQSGLVEKAGYSGVEIDMLTSPKGGDERIPFSEIARKYGKAHVYINGHKESVGLGIMEAATAGCLVVTPKGYIADELLRMVRRITFDDGIVPWEPILKKIDPAASRAKAVQQSWSLACEKMLAYLEGFSK